MNDRPWWQWIDAQWSRSWGWAKANRYWLVSIAVSVASSPGDGGYIARYIPAFFAYAWNFAVDAATEMAMHAFVLIWRRGSGWPRKLLSVLLLLCHFAMFYFAVVFAHAEFELQFAGQPQYLYWSLAAFGPAGLTTLAIAQALMETRAKSDKKTTKPIKLHPATVQDKQAILESLNGDGASLTVDLWNAELEKAGCQPDNPSTARYWINKAQPERVEAGEERG